MKKGYAIAILLIILVLPALFIALGHLGEPRTEFSRIKFYKIANPAGGQDSVYRTAGKFSFNCQWGYPVDQDTFRDHIWVSNVFFTTCRATCPRIMASMKEVYNKYKGDPEVRFLSITVDPEVDSVARLRQYGDSLGIVKGQWYLITGGKAEIYRFANSQMLFSAMTDDNDSIRFVHDSRVRLMDKKGRLRGEFPDATQPGGAMEIIDEIERLKVEYRAGKEE